MQDYVLWYGMGMANNSEMDNYYGQLGITDFENYSLKAEQYRECSITV